MANHLPIRKQSIILSLLAEGQSVRATARIADVSPVTVLKLLLEAGEKARDIHDTMMVNIRSRFIECDEQWAYIARKQRRVTRENESVSGDFYTFVAIDADTKLAPCYRVGKRTAENTRSFMSELATRVPGRFQLSTDAYTPYPDAVESAFGADIDYAQIHKDYAETSDSERRYSRLR